MLLKKTIKWTGMILLGVGAVSTTLWLTIPRWLPVVAKSYLPEGVSLSLTQPRLQQWGVFIDDIALKSDSCTLANVQQFTFNYQKQQIDSLSFNSQQLTINEGCFSQLSFADKKETATVPLDIHALLATIPHLSVDINHVSLMDNQRYNGHFQLKSDTNGRLISYQGDNTQIQALIRDNQWLDIKQLKINLPDDNQIELAAEIALPLNVDSLPENGSISTTLLTSHYAYPLVFIAQWQGNSGTISIAEQGGGQALAVLPWNVTAENITIEKGRWEWFGLDQPLRGGVNINIAQWQQGLTGLRLTARLNVMTQGHAGKGNLVMTIPETAINWLDADIPIQLTGIVNKDLMQASAQLPVKVTGMLTDPTIEFQPGSLLRFKG
ncbi:hypothetical protein ACLHVA_001122 [Proteus mirabilis]